jgi:hypothetical protein
MRKTPPISCTPWVKSWWTMKFGEVTAMRTATRRPESSAPGSELRAFSR